MLSPESVSLPVPVFVRTEESVPLMTPENVVSTFALVTRVLDCRLMLPAPAMLLRVSLPPSRKVAPEATMRSDASAMRSSPEVARVPAFTVVSPV